MTTPADVKQSAERVMDRQASLIVAARRLRDAYVEGDEDRELEHQIRAVVDAYDTMDTARREHVDLINASLAALHIGTSS